MAERRRKKKQQNWEERSYLNFGPKFKIDTCNPQIGFTGQNVYQIYGVTDSKDQSTIGFTESGLLNIYNDRDIQITAGFKNEQQGIDIALNTFDGDITLTAMRSGSIRLRGRSIIIDAAEDVDIVAGRNISIQAGSEIKLRAPSIDIPEDGGFLGGLLGKVGGTLVQTALAATPFGAIAGPLVSQVASSAIGSAAGSAGQIFV